MFLVQNILMKQNNILQWNERLKSVGMSELGVYTIRGFENKLKRELMFRARIWQNVSFKVSKENRILIERLVIENL